MVFVSPGYLLLLPLIFPLFYFRHIKRPWEAYPLVFGAWNGPVFRGKAPFHRFLYIFASLSFWMGVVLIILSLAGPSVVSAEKEYLEKGADIAIVFDQSPSMAAEDFDGQRRFDTAKMLTEAFISSRENDAIGLITFGKEAALRVPPTLDYAYVLDTLAALSVGELGDGTAIGAGVALALSHLKTCEGDKKFIILVTDGEHNAGVIDPMTSAMVAKSLSIVLYAIGIGAAGLVPMEYTDPESGRSFRGMYESGFDEETLAAMADMTGGRYYGAVDSLSLKSAFEGVDLREPGKTMFKLNTTTRERHRLFLILALVCVLTDILIRKAVLKEGVW